MGCFGKDETVPITATNDLNCANASRCLSTSNHLFHGFCLTFTSGGSFPASHIPKW